VRPNEERWFHRLGLVHVIFLADAVEYRGHSRSIAFPDGVDQTKIGANCWVMSKASMEEPCKRQNASQQFLHSPIAVGKLLQMDASLFQQCQMKIRQRLRRGISNVTSAFASRNKAGRLV